MGQAEEQGGQAGQAGQVKRQAQDQAPAGADMAARLRAAEQRVAALAAENAELRRVEQALRESQATLVLGEQINRSGSWTWQVGARMLDCSAQFCRMFGFGAGRALVSFDDFLERLHADDRARVRAHCLDAVAAGRRIAVDYRLLAPDGLRFITAIGTPLTPAASENVAQLADKAGGSNYVGTAVDVTERRAAEHALRQAQADLARVARINTVGQLTASIAHELNQPLMSISSNAGAGLRWLDRQPPPLEEVRASLHDIAAQSQRAGTIIAGLQALTRNAQPLLQPVDLHAGVREILEISRAELERNNIVLELALMAESGRVLGDAVQLQQVLLNLVINAVEAMTPVMGRVRLLTICSWSTATGRLVLRIDDAGVGMVPGTDAADWFEPFYTTKEGGMGMGLAISRGIIAAHHGAMRASPRLPCGCSVEFDVPELPAGARND